MSCGRKSLAVLVIVLAGALLAGPAQAATFTVNKLTDPTPDPSPGACTVSDCSLREAVRDANATIGADFIVLGTGTYTLALAGTGENAALTGDLDVTGPLTITGAGARSTTIDANSIDRVLETLLPSTAPGVVQITGVRVTGGSQSGIVNGGGTALSLTDSAVVGNVSRSQGGGIDANSGQSLALLRTTVSGNTAAIGGGVYVANPATLTNVTVSGNTATSQGGGLYNEFNTSTLTNSTVAFNTAPASTGGGIANFDVTQVKNTIVSNNSGDNCDTFDLPTSLGNNLESAVECGFKAGGDLQSSNPQLGKLANNGGGTDTHALAASSPAVDAGDNANCPATDQRGVARPQGPVCDIGAYEFDPPETTISAGPSGTTPDSTPEFSFSSSKAGSTFQCRVDAGAFVSCSSPHATAALGDGRHTFEVRAIDALGQVDQTPASRTFTVDTAAPETTISAGPSGATADSTPEFTFASEAGASFECRVDAGAFTSCSSPHTTAALGDGQHTFEVRAIDGVGNIDQTPASRSFTVDTAAPETTISAGPSGATADSTPEFTFSSSEAGSTFQCRVDAGAFTSCSPPHATAALGDGQHTFEVRAIDALGQVDPTPASRAFTVDTTPPQTTITAGPAGPTSDSTPDFAFDSSETGSTFQCRIDAAAFASCTSPHTTAALGDGQHTFEVRAIDALGNVDQSPASRTFTVDTTPPETNITAGPAGATADSTPDFTFTSSEAGSTFECRIDAAAFASCASPHTTATLGDGQHTFEVRAIDALGNVDPTPASRAFTVDRPSPDTVISSGPPVVTRDRTPTFAFSSEVAGARFECSLDGSPFSPCSSPYVTSRALAAGRHTFQARARDASGNVDPTPATVVFVIPAQLSDLPRPKLGRTYNVEPVGDGPVNVSESGAAARARTGARASVTVPGLKGRNFIPLREARQVRIGSFIDTRRGRVRLQTARDSRGTIQSGEFFSGVFQTLQSRKKSAKGLTELRLKGSSFGRCRTAGHGKKAGAARHSRRRVRRLRGNAKGRFRTGGRYSAATVRGTIWGVSDRCDGTLTKVTRGKVAVRDFRRRKNVLVRAGKSYLARGPR